MRATVFMCHGPPSGGARRRARLRRRACPGPRCAPRRAAEVCSASALPWFNFLSGPTAWDLEDWAAYIDNLARSRQHARVSRLHRRSGAVLHVRGAFLAGRRRRGLPQAELDTTATARWGYRPMATSRFIAGSHLLYEGDVFGSEAALPRGDLESRYQRAEALLRFVMARAKGWGMRTFLGFEAGIVPPEVHSLVQPDARLPGGELDPFHPAAIKIFHDLLARTVRVSRSRCALALPARARHVFRGGDRPPSGAARLLP